MDTKLSLVLCVPLLLAAHSAVPSSPNPTKLTASSFEEHYLETVPVSGAVLIGVQYLDKQNLKTKSLWAQLPSDHLPELCISVVTDDGRYNATERFHLDSGVKDWVVLDFPTRKFEELVKHGSQRIALLAVLKRSCGDSTIAADDVYVPLSWSSEIGLSRLSILLNSGGRDAQIFPSPSGPLADCDSFGTEAARIAFDTHCTLDSPRNGNLWSGYFKLARFGETPRQFQVQIWTRR